MRVIITDFAKQEIRKTASLNKMIYRIKDDQVLVEDFWDVRREPSDLKGQIIRKR